MVIDGYNVMNALPELRAITKVDFDGAREKLIEMMAEYRSYLGIDMVIVFDAHLATRSREHTEMIKGIKIVFTKEKMTADSYIEKVISEMTANRQVIVVTNDWTEQLMVLGSGASRVSVRELQMDLMEARRRINETTDNYQEKEFLSNRIDKKTLEKLEKIRRKSQT